MESLAVVDTNVVSYIFRRHTLGGPYSEILKNYQKLLISFQTVAELEVLVAKNNWGESRRAELVEFLKTYGVAFPNRRVCAEWATIRIFRGGLGEPIEAQDAWIAATALVLNAALITHDVFDFRKIDGLRVVTSARG
ncbi:hypothetical protein BH09SUM1_BH09SUM1_17450 [soil metagenome]